MSGSYKARATAAPYAAHNIHYYPDNPKMFKTPIMEPTFPPLTPYKSPIKAPMDPPITPLPPSTPFIPPAIENPIGDLKELCDFVRTPYEKHFEEEGHAHAKRYKCIMDFCGKKFESDWMSNQKEAEKNAALKLLTILPVRKVDDSHVNQRGSSHEMHFQVELIVPDGMGTSHFNLERGKGKIFVNITEKSHHLHSLSISSLLATPVVPSLISVDFKDKFESDWMKKKLEARRDVMQKIVKHYFGDNLMEATQATGLGPSTAHSPAASPARSPAHDPVQAAGASYRTLVGSTKPFAGMNEGAYGGGREHYVYSSDNTSSKVAEYLTRWQRRHLDKGYENHILDSLLTVAFIHPSFTHSEELKEGVKRFLGVKWASYERLEFYGDAILGFVASRMLFEESDTDGPHELTIKRQKIVREDACCSCMKKMMLDKYVIHRDILQTPSAKVLCDIYEAIIGALYYALSEDAYGIIQGLINQNREP